MLCPEGAATAWQCSGDTIIRLDNGVAVTRSGVQVYGRSTVETDPVDALGLAPVTTAIAKNGALGVVDTRLLRSAAGIVTDIRLLKRNIGISFDSLVERPVIIETFRGTQGRMLVDAGGVVTSNPVSALTNALGLPLTTNLTHYDYKIPAKTGTHLNYSNNVYFPRNTSLLTMPPGFPLRCPGGSTPTNCYNGDRELVGSGAAAVPATVPLSEAGTYRQTNPVIGDGATPDTGFASRWHADGDIHAGNMTNGSPNTYFPPQAAEAVPFPGSKGIRNVFTRSFFHSNIAAWFTNDTHNISDWTLGATPPPEHTKKRYGMVAFGNVSNPADALDITGTLSYTQNAVWGWYTAEGSKDPKSFTGNATVTVNLATRRAEIKINTLKTFETVPVTLPITFTFDVPMGAAGSNVATYMAAPVSSSVTDGAITQTLSGGISARFFGPIAPTTFGNGPEEVAGTFQLSNASGPQGAIIGGFVARKQP